MKLEYRQAESISHGAGDLARRGRTIAASTGKGPPDYLYNCTYRTPSASPLFRTTVPIKPDTPQPAQPKPLRPPAIKMKFLLAVLLAPVTLALPAKLDARSPAPLSPLEVRQSCAATCGNNICYYASTVDRAVSAGCQRYQDNNPVNSYPHTYNNYEGFDFPVSGPYQEFPLLRSFNSNPYTGGSPGADRVIFNGNCQLAGVITHDGASGNAFVECEDALAVMENGTATSGEDMSGGNGTASGSDGDAGQDDESGAVRVGTSWMLVCLGTVLWETLLQL